MTETARPPSFWEAMIGTWVGRRETEELRGEPVEAVWEWTADGRFLRERWYTSGSGGVPRLAARALFLVVDGAPAGYVAAYASGTTAAGESRRAAGAWVLTHGWDGGGPDAEIHLRLEGGDRYVQEVFAVEADGRRRLESRSVLHRQG